MQKSIHLQRTQSILKEMLQEAISGLNDVRVNGTSIVEVVCSRGKYNADVYIHPDFYSPEEKKQVLKGLKKAEGILREYVLSVSGWYKCPRLNFCFDETFQKSKNLDEIFNQIAGQKETKQAQKSEENQENKENKEDEEGKRC